MRKVLALMCLVLGLMFTFTNIPMQANSSIHIEVTSNTPVFDNRTGSLVKVGELVRGQQFTVVKDYGVNWWQIYWGSHYGYIAKSNTKTIKNVSFKNAINRVASSKQTIVTGTIAPVYDNTSGQLVQFANIEANQRLPVAKVMGNWFGIEINGRLGYVHNSKVAKVEESIPPTQQANSSIHIEVTSNTPVFDNRTGSLVKVGELVRGQQFTVVKDYGVNWWQIYWGSHYGYIAKSNTKTIKNVSFKNAINRVTSSNKTIVTATIAPVYDNTSGQLVQFANVEANQRLPVVKVMGNWFGIEINGRLGYVHNSKVAKIEESIPPTQNISGKRYIQALEQAPLYDLRDKNRTHVIAELLKGQQFEITSYESGNYYQLRWGKTFLYVEKSKVKLISKQSYKNVATDVNVKNQYFIPKASMTPIYDNSTGKLIPMANIKGNYRYPILGTYGNWIETTIGGRKGFIHKSKLMMDKGVPVLMYHHILQNHELGNYKNVSTTVTLNQFREQIGYLASKGYETISVADLERYMKGQITLPVHSVLITFDDGLLTTKVYAYEILKKYNFQATQFLISYRNEIAPSNQTFNPNKLQFISKEEMDSMSDVYAYESHTYNLHDLVGNQSKVLLVSKQQLIADLKKNLASLPHSKAFSYPFGKYNNELISVIKSLGYTTAFTTKPGYNLPYGNVFEIKRLEATQKTTLSNFKKMVAPYE